jgi:hypothetical protein
VAHGSVQPYRSSTLGNLFRTASQGANTPITECACSERMRSRALARSYVAQHKPRLDTYLVNFSRAAIVGASIRPVFGWFCVRRRSFRSLPEVPARRDYPAIPVLQRTSNVAFCVPRAALVLGRCGPTAIAGRSLSSCGPWYEYLVKAAEARSSRVETGVERGSCTHEDVCCCFMCDML